MLKKLLHTRYRVEDLDRTVAFYRDVLGLQETRRHTSPRGSKLVFFRCPGSEEEIELCQFDESGPVKVGSDITHLAFEVDDIHAVHDALRVEGVEFYSEPNPLDEGAFAGGYWVYAKDPDGVSVEFIQVGPASAAATD